MRNHFLILFFAIGLISKNYSEAISIEKNNSNRDITPFIDYFIDESGKLSYNQIKNQNIPFQKNLKNRRSFGYNVPAVWFRFSFKNENLKEQMVLVFDEYRSDHLMVYFGNQPERLPGIELGDKLPFHDRPIPGRSFAVHLPETIGKSIPVYVRMQNAGPGLFSARIMTLGSYIAMERNNLLGFVIYMGIATGFILYNTAFYFITREKTYIIYTAVITLISLLMLKNSGYGYEFLWREPTYIYEHFVALILPLVLLFTAEFILRLLELKSTLPVVYKIYRYLQTFLILWLPFSSLINIAHALKINWLLGLLFFPILMFVAIFQAFKKIKVAKLFLAGWSPLLFSASFFFINGIFQLEYDRWSDLLLFSSAGLEHLIMSLLIGVKSKILISEKENLIKNFEAIKYQNLQERMRPHFLFNSLNSIYSMIETGSKEAGEAVLVLSRIYQYLNNESYQKTVSIKKELDFLQQYLYVMKLRFGERVRINIDTEKLNMEIVVPPLTIQPIVENCFKHGMPEFMYSMSPLDVKISIQNEGHEGASIHIINNGNKLKDHQSSERTLGNIRERLTYLYKEVELKIKNLSKGGVKVTLKFDNLRRMEL